MMRVIKFHLNFGDNLIHSDWLLEPLHFELQDNEWTVWCKEYSTIPADRPLELYVATTGEYIPHEQTKFVGTATNRDKSFVVHLFEVA